MVTLGFKNVKDINVQFLFQEHEKDALESKSQTTGT